MLSPQHIRGSIGRIDSFVFQLHVFIKKMGRVLGLRLGRSLAVRATHWRISIKNGEKNLAETDKGSWYEQSSLLILEQPSTSSASSGLVGIELDGAAETFLCLEFLFLASILNWMKLCFTQLQDSFKKGVNFGSKNKTSSLRELGFFGQIGFETFKDGLEIWSRGCQDTNLRNRAFPFFEIVLPQWSPT